jgi:superoxide dismutase, Fe-Mn family
MTHVAKKFDRLIGEISGLSEKQLRAHFGLYQGYVKKLNEIEQKLVAVDTASANSSYGEISELMRRRPFAYNGAYLHQLYFENLTGRELQPDGDLRAAIEKQFRSVEEWFEQVRAGLLSEPGWVLLVRSRLDGDLRNILLSQHHVGLLAEHDIILAFDGWEHAYMIDYATDKADYIDMLNRVIDWNVASQRYETATLIARQAA